ncbi:MAG: hypothetical protein ABI136_06845 [Ginsengibacter sp.]
MIQKFFLLSVMVLASLFLFAQNEKDSIVKVDENYITLSEIVIGKNLDIASFVQRVKTDTTFYKAFRNLRIVGYNAINDIRMLDKNEKTEASLHSTIKQIRKGNCRTMQVLNQKTTGDFFDKKGNFNYYTAQMYAGLFFTKDSVCGENNIVKGYEFSTAGLSGIEKHKEQLKMLFFNPGKKINGLPFISNKTAIFSPEMADNYDMNIDYTNYNENPCYVFNIKVKNDRKNNVIIDEMVTWFDAKTFDIIARNYSLKYDAGLYDFDVKMKVQMTKVGNLLVPSLLTYNGNWKVVFNKRERGVFTASLSDFVE